MVVVDESDAERDDANEVDVDVEVDDVDLEACCRSQEADPAKSVPTGLDPTDEQGAFAPGEG